MPVKNKIYENLQFQLRNKSQEKSMALNNVI